MSSPLGAWRLPLRIARRDALRHRGRSVLVLVMIALPVLAVTAADVLMQTSTVSGVESIDRRMGASEALVTTSLGSGRVAQQPDPYDFALSGGSGELPLPTAERVAGVLGGARLLELRHGETEVRTDKGAVSAELTEVDLADPLTAGLFDLVSGRLPEDAGEVVVNEFLAGKGFAVGETLDRPGTGQVDPIIVGIAESTTTRDSPIAAGPLGAFGLETDDGQQWLVDGGPVSWSQVRELNDLGATVASRAVITDPPPQSRVGRGGPGLRRHRRGDRGRPGADRGDGTDRGRPARRSGLRGRRAKAAAQPGPHVGHGWHSRAVASRRHRWRLRARQRRRPHRAWWSGSGWPSSWCPSCSRGPGPTSARSTCRGCTWPGSRASACSARSWPRWCRRTSPPARTSSRSSPAAAVTGLRPSSPRCSAWCCSASASRARSSAPRAAASSSSRRAPSPPCSA